MGKAGLVGKIEEVMVVERIVEEIADREGVEPTELSPPLQTAVDTDALEALFSHSVDDEPPAGIHVELTYAGYNVTVERAEDVKIRVR